MFDLDRWNEIWSSLSKNKMRSFLTAFGVFWGIFMLIVMAGAGKGLENGVVEGISKFATNSAFMWTERTGKPYAGFRRGRNWTFKNKDVTFLDQTLPELELVAPRLFGWNLRAGDNTIRGERTGSYHIKGDYPFYIDIDPATMKQGRFINDIDIQERRKVCVIGETVLEEMFQPDEDPIGQYLKVAGIYYQVIGVLHPETRVNIGGDKRETVFLPFTTMQQAYNYGDDIHMIMFTVQRNKNVSEVEETVKRLIKERHQIAPDDEQAIVSLNIEKEFKKINGLFTAISALTWIVGVGTLMAGVIGVSNIMLVIIKERTKEIGIQRAIGATPATIMKQIIMESVFLTTLAGYIGLSLGVGLLELVSMGLEMAQSGSEDDIFFRHPEISLGTALLALFVLILAGVFAGTIPAKRALQIKPIDALRDE